MIRFGHTPTEPGLYILRRRGRGSGLRAIWLVELKPRRCDGRLAVWASKPTAGGPSFAATVGAVGGEWSERIDVSLESRP